LKSKLVTILGSVGFLAVVFSMFAGMLYYTDYRAILIFFAFILLISSIITYAHYTEFGKLGPPFIGVIVGSLGQIICILCVADLPFDVKTVLMWIFVYAVPIACLGGTAYIIYKQSKLMYRCRTKVKAKCIANKQVGWARINHQSRPLWAAVYLFTIEGCTASIVYHIHKLKRSKLGHCKTLYVNPNNPQEYNTVSKVLIKLPILGMLLLYAGIFIYLIYTGEVNI